MFRNSTKKNVLIASFFIFLVIISVWFLPANLFGIEKDSSAAVNFSTTPSKMTAMIKKAIPLRKIATSTKDMTELKAYDVPILMYHAIDEYTGNGIKELYVTPTNFENQMRYLKSDGFTPITFDDLMYLDNIEKPILITLDDGYKNNLNAYHILKEINDESFQSKATIFMIGQKIDTKSGLSTEDLIEMSDSGIISVQSHTVTHPMLTATTDYEMELGEIKKILENITGKKVNAIAYPSGKYNDTVIEHTKKYYDYAVTTKPGFANTGASPYELKRVRINYSTSLEAFKHLVNQ